ncbi:MAG: hypothetical protein ACI9RM_002452 [Ulvibacter sp.]|jgi:hypothetical protein
MKKLFPLALLFFTLTFLNAQVDQPSVGPGYSEFTYYRLADGELNTSAHQTWDIAFSSGQMSAGVFVNEGVGLSFTSTLPQVELYLTSSTDFSNVDTAGMSRILNKKRVLLAKCIVQLNCCCWSNVNKYLFLDEPTSSLDIEQQYRYCHHCETYSITFNNLIMNFDAIGFDGFKDNLSNCYGSNLEGHFPEHRDMRDITFGTRLDGLQFLFSINEVGALLTLIQEAQLSEMFVEEIS